jgi:hypothetical protein
MELGRQWLDPTLIVAKKQATSSLTTLARLYERRPLLGNFRFGTKSVSLTVAAKQTTSGLTKFFVIS